MPQRLTAVRATGVVNRARRLVEDLRVEIQVLHVQELDRAFLATNKGMIYRTREERNEAAVN